jgi:inhibitor of cysteine peptidase
MNTRLAFATTAIIAGLTLAACAPAIVKETSTQPVAARPDYLGASVSVTAQDFGSQANLTKTVEVNQGQLLMVSLDSNATTGFSWSEAASINDKSIVEQKSHQYNAPGSTGTPVIGAAGTETWTFNALKTGKTTISMEYDRPCAGGEKAARTFVLTVTVK